MAEYAIGVSLGGKVERSAVCLVWAITGSKTIYRCELAHVWLPGTTSKRILSDLLRFVTDDAVARKCIIGLDATSVDDDTSRHFARSLDAHAPVHLFRATPSRSAQLWQLASDLIHAQRLGLAPRLQHWKGLRAVMDDLEANPARSHRSAENDDLVLALLVALWAHEKPTIETSTGEP